MNSKWYLGTLFMILAALGIGVKPNTAPNQEIVVQFDNETASYEETQGAIALVKEQLQNVGAENIQVRGASDGKLKITYFSKVDVANIKRILSHGEKLEFGLASNSNDGSSEFQTQYDLFGYEVNVSEIHNNSDLPADFNGNIVTTLEVKTGNRRYIDTDLLFFFTPIKEQELNSTQKTAYQLHSLIALLVDRNSHNIPEVRAGPIT